MEYKKACLFILFVALIVASASASVSNGPGTDILKAKSISTSLSPGTWESFEWGSGEPAPATPAFPYASKVASKIIVTDAYMTGDQFKVYDNQASLGVTSTPVSADIWTGDPDEAYAAPEYSKGCFDIAPGEHVISIEAVKNPWGSGGAFIKVEEGSCATPAPEFPSMFLPLTLIVGMLGAVLVIRKTQSS